MAEGPTERPTERSHNPPGPTADLSIVVLPQKIDILVIGRIGAGKSTLINAIRGERDLRTERRGVAARYLERGTESYIKEIQRDGIAVTLSLTDTNGMCDGNHPKRNIKEFGSKKIPVDLILICIRLTERFDPKIFLEIKELQVLYKHFWDHSIFVLTFTNEYEHRLKHDYPDIGDKDISDRIQEEAGIIYSEFKKEFVDKRKSVKADVLANVPFICAGELLNESDREKIAAKIRHSDDGTEDEELTERIKTYGILSTSVDWFSDLLHLCIERCSEDATIAMRHVYLYLIARQFVTFRDKIVGLVYKPGMVEDIPPHEVY